MVTVTTRAPSATHATLASTMLEIMKGTPSITPRSRKQIAAALKNEDIALAFDKTQLVGWLIATPYSSSVQELGMAYLVPAYRRKGYLTKLIRPLIGKRPVNIAVTYEQRLADQLEDEWRFRTGSLGEFQRLTHSKFLLQRLKSPATIISVIRHASKSRPLYLVRLENYEYESR